jgi:AAA15 family ATPase/GTPase
VRDFVFKVPAMLIRFRVQNHKSIRDEQELSFVAASLSEFPEKLIRPQLLEVDLLRVVGIYGANASGKSTVLDALDFMQDAVLESHREWKPKAPIPRQPFRLSSDRLEMPSLFEVDFLLDQIRYTYGFILDSEVIREEWLFAYPQGKKQRWFVRKGQRPKDFVFSRFLSGENKAVQALTRPNSLFLSTAAQNNHAKLTPIFEWFDKSLNFVDSQTRDVLRSQTAVECVEPAFRESVKRLLMTADLGITGIDIEQDAFQNEIIKAMAKVLEDNQSPWKILDAQRYRPVLLHRSAVDGGDVRFPFGDESRGTQALFGLAGQVVKTLADGGILCVDELDASLHPLMAVEIVKLFNDPKNNPHGAQLLFNTHDTNILEYAELRRDQIWFTEKDKSGATHLYPLTDYKARKEENIKRGYLQGRYGAIPFLETPTALLPNEEDGEVEHP